MFLREFTEWQPSQINITIMNLPFFDTAARAAPYMKLHRLQYSLNNLSTEQMFEYIAT